MNNLSLGGKLSIVLFLILFGISIGKHIGEYKVYKSNVRHEVMYKSHGKYYWLNEFRLVGIDKVEEK